MMAEKSKMADITFHFALNRPFYLPHMEYEGSIGLLTGKMIFTF
jgi:hypothetical protein